MNSPRVIDKRKTIAALAAVLLALPACDGTLSLFPEVEAEKKYAVAISSRGIALSEGSVIVPGEDLTLMARSQESNPVEPDAIGFEFLDDSKGPAAKAIIGKAGAKTPFGMEGAAASTAKALLGEPLALKAPASLAPGRYTLLTRVYRPDGSQWEDSLRVFALAAPPMIDYLQSFPLAAVPGRPILVEAACLAPEGARPWFRFGMDGATFASAEGSREDATATSAAGEATGMVRYSARVLWLAPGKEGLYTLQAEAFPFTPGPGDGGDFPFKAEARGEMKVVASEAAATSGEFGPAASYSRLLHLRGDYLDEATGEVASPLGSPGVAAHSEGFGMYLDGDAGIELRGFVLPSRADGTIAPASLRFRLAAGPHRAGAVLLSSSDGAGLFLRLEESAGGGIALVLSKGSKTVRSSSGIALPEGGVAAEIDLAIVPGPDATEVLWSSGGAPLAAEALPIALGSALSGGSTRIGAASGGFKGIVDEFGVYCRDAAGKEALWDGGFAAESAKAAGEAFVLAEGFDGLTPPERAGLSIGGFARASLGELLLEPNSYLSMKGIAVPPRGLWLDISMDAAPQAIVSLLAEGDKDYLVRIRLDGSILVAGSARSVEPLSGELSIRLTVSDEGSSVAIGPWSFPLPGNLAGKKLELRVSNPTKSEVGIASLRAEAPSKAKKAAETAKRRP